MNRMKAAVCLVTLLLAPVAAAALELGLPLQCEPGRSCWMPRYVDLDPGPGFADYMCGTRLGENDHSGTDFAIPSLAAMRAGVPVVAAADGHVRNTRDGMDDVSVETVGKAAIEGRNCGNGVVIRHGDGWETQYCHLRKGSVAVQPDQEVKRGQVLGMVGMSGEASFPHVHLSVRRGEDRVDPFRGVEGGPACGPGEAPLWQPEVLAKLAYLPVMLTHVGFAPQQPRWEQVQNGDFDAASLPVAAPALILWLDAFGIAEGDLVSWRITGPDGSVLFEDARTEAKSQARSFRFVGKRRPPDGWPPGAYTGTVTIARDGAPTQERSLRVELR
jgi:hypothetical protein